ncbi:hypothetical protein ACFPL7_02330 [Dongia soli]|uniref:Uncharacterized protein n=1 Tax=Dongia soli TaxID=600628 RepID=A0ABU5EFQ2_9PROT|nr:hypothetical protein [Dongia soli]MDY0885235.1 hypothetical protein [Dongia soli]
MDLIRKLNAKLVALDYRNRVIAYSDSEDAQRFLDEILSAQPYRVTEIRIHDVCPYVWTNPDKWYAENTPLLRYQGPGASGDVALQTAG